MSTAARWIYQGKRLDMQGPWRLTERMLDIAVERWEAERHEGELHTPGHHPAH